MYGTDLNSGLNISAGAVGLGALGVTQSIVLAIVVLFAAIAVVTTVRAIRHRAARKRRSETVALAFLVSEGARR